MKSSSVIKVALSLIACCNLAGCAQFTNLVATSARPERPAVSQVLQYYHNAQALSQNDLKELYEQEEARMGAGDDPERALRVALLLMLQETTFRDADRAAGLLQAYIQLANRDGDLRALADLLLNSLSEAQRHETRYRETKLELDVVIKEKSQLQQQYERTKKQLARIQKEQNKHEEKYQKVSKALRQEQETVENLRKQIEQLKSIEKTLNERKLKKPPAT